MTKKKVEDNLVWKSEEKGVKGKGELRTRLFVEMKSYIETTHSHVPLKRQTKTCFLRVNTAEHKFVCLCMCVIVVMIGF